MEVGAVGRGVKLQIQVGSNMPKGTYKWLFFSVLAEVFCALELNVKFDASRFVA